MAIFALGVDGLFVGSDANDGTCGDQEEGGVERWETPTSGGRANAIEIRIKNEDEGAWIILTDDEQGQGGGTAVRVLEWGPIGGVRVSAEWPTSDSAERGSIEGASHAIWLD
jgi:carboxy-cis,cis-muconate cyclase